jgi:hypothetical protein
MELRLLYAIKVIIHGAIKLLKIRGEMLNIRGEIAHFKAHRSHKYVNNAWRESSNSPPTLLFIPFPVPPH